jgi:hypothetical protein
MSLTQQEIEHVNLIVKGVSAELKGEIQSINTLYEERNRNIYRDLKEIKGNCKDNEKKIDCIEKTLSYYLGKAAGIALMVSIIGTIAGMIINILVK